MGKAQRAHQGLTFNDFDRYITPAHADQTPQRRQATPPCADTIPTRLSGTTLIRIAFNMNDEEGTRRSKRSRRRTIRALSEEESLLRGRQALRDFRSVTNPAHTNTQKNIP
jgi:hypothetical protein